MARYCDAKDLRALIPDTYRDAALADSSGGDEADAGLLAAVLESACNETDALIEGRVRLPLATVPRKLRVAAAYIALELLAIRRNLSLRDETAEKISWWRNWLSKVGEGELRLDAPGPDDASGGGGAGHASSVAVRPAVTGSHGLMFGLLLAFSVFAWVSAETSRAVEARTWAFDVPEAADVFDNPAEMEWAAGESLVLSYVGGTLAEGQTARWEVAAGTNLWLSLDGAGNGWSWTLAPTQSCLPSGRYAGRIAVYGSEGGQVSFQRVAALQSIRVHQGTGGFAQVAPVAVVLTNYALRAWVVSNFTGGAEFASAMADFSAHVESTDNPHSVTLRQAIDADTDGAFDVMYDAFGISADRGEFGGASGYGHSILFEDALIEGGFEFQTRPTHGYNGLATTNEVAEVVSDLSLRLDGLFAECQGSWRWPDYFTVEGVETGTMSHSATNTATTTQTDYNVQLDVGTSHVLNGWRILTRVFRQSDWDRGVSWAVAEAGGIDPEALEVEGDEVFFAAGATAPEEGAWVRMAGSLGECSAEAVLEWDAAAQSATSTVYRFTGPAAGSLLAASWNTVLGAASNGYAASPRKSVELRTWPNGYGNRTNHVSAGWNTNFWGYGLGDFSCVSYHTEGPTAKPGEGAAYGVYMPITMVTPRHGIVANHWKPLVGSNVYWVSRSGAILTNRVVAYRRVRGDLAVARMESAFSTNDVVPAKLLNSMWNSYLYGSSNVVSGLFGVPVIGFDCAERGYVMNWMPTPLRKGKGQPIDEYFGLSSANGWTMPFFRANAVGGDSGSPVFWPVDGQTVLLGCFHFATGGPMPGKYEVDEAIAAWGDDERAEEYNLQTGGWNNPDLPTP